MKKIVGLVGEKGGGKGSFFNTLKEFLPNKNIDRVSSSELLMKTLELWGLSNSRENMINLVKAMNDGFGEGTLTNALKQGALNSDADIVIIDSIRLQSDLDMLRELPDSVLLYITADPEIRFARTKARGEKAGEDKTTFEEFQAQEQAHTEKLIGEIGKQADFTISNNGNFEEFKSQVLDFANKNLSN